ncbi:MAG: hypothetical protein ACTHJ8_01460, partial [Mucilaginibacter sp.]
AQAEFKPWGNLNGIRIKGQLFEFNSRIVVVGQDWSKMLATAKERQKPKYILNGNEQIVNTQIDSLHFTESVKDNGRGSAKITIKCLPGDNTNVEGVYFNVLLPESIYANSSVKSDNNPEQPLSKLSFDGMPQKLKALKFTASSQNLSISADTVSSVIFKPGSGSQKKFIQLYFPVCSGKLTKGQVFTRTYEIKVSGDIDNSPAALKLDTSVQGRPFAGLGGNFRIQNPKTDPEVIDYCLKNLRVAWGRVEMPWSAWQPDSTANPSATDTSQLNIRVRRAMQMAQRLSQMNIPVILTAWFPPQWAVDGKLSFAPTPEGIWGNPLKKSAMQGIYQSITDYILYLKAHYGVEVQFFSFNESDLGINVRQTAEEHDELIKGLGAYFESKGLKTRLLLGDNSDATTYKFIYPAMDDPETRGYIGAVSFHSWRGWDTPILQKWADAAKQVNRPLIVGEGSIDAAAWNYPDYFLNPSYALEEINLYTRLLAICQPLSILQWQLTSDYSPLKGGGIFGNDGPLEPTQRFWNLKQLASTPKDLSYMSISVDKDEISCAALGDNTSHTYAIHLVNNGTSRQVTLTGLPAGVHKFNIYITNKHAAMKKKSVKVKDHVCSFRLKERSFVTLISA